MAKFYAEKSEKGEAVNLGVESAVGGGFVSFPVDKNHLLHAASVAGAAVLLRRLGGKQGAARKEEKRARKALSQGLGFSGKGSRRGRAAERRRPGR